jgi:hypothetical protein
MLFPSKFVLVEPAPALSDFTGAGPTLGGDGSGTLDLGRQASLFCCVSVEFVGAKT